MNLGAWVKLHPLVPWMVLVGVIVLGNLLDLIERGHNLYRMIYTISRLNFHGFKATKPDWLLVARRVSQVVYYVIVIAVSVWFLAIMFAVTKW